MHFTCPSLDIGFTVSLLMYVVEFYPILKQQKILGGEQNKLATLGVWGLDLSKMTKPTIPINELMLDV